MTGVRPTHQTQPRPSVPWRRETTCGRSAFREALATTRGPAVVTVPGRARADHEPLEARLVDQDLKQLLPDAPVPPPAEASMRVLPAAKVGRQVAPRGAGPKDPEDGIDKAPVVLGDASLLSDPAGQARFQPRPHPIVQIVAVVVCPCHRSPLTSTRMTSPGPFLPSRSRPRRPYPSSRLKSTWQ